MKNKLITIIIINPICKAPRKATEVPWFSRYDKSSIEDTIQYNTKTNIIIVALTP